MDNPKKMDVVDWRDSSLPIVSTVKARHFFLPPTLIGILGTLLLHAMLIQSVSFGSRRLKAQLPETPESADALRRATASVESLVLITLPISTKETQATSQSAISSLPNLSKLKINSPIGADPPAFLNLETLALSEDQASKSTAAGGDGAEQARLFGIYTGQIQARIDRGWRRPRTPINEDSTSATGADVDQSFQCEAQIVQDVRGNVQEILLPRCNGSAAWQRSLVLAIQQASPLPAPPSAKVFTQSITLNFVGLPFEEGSSLDEYELPAGKTARAN
jgi:hypothetical protein